MSLQRDVDRQRLEQIAPRQVTADPSMTWRERIRLTGQRLRQAVEWAGRNNRPRPVQVQVNGPQAPSAAPAAPRVFPTDGGLTPDQKLARVADDIAGKDRTATPGRVEAASLDRRPAAREARPESDVRARQQAEAALQQRAVSPAASTDFTREYTGPPPPQTSRALTNAPRPRR